MVFTGNYEHTIDEKNRLAIPAKFRSRLDSERDGRCFVLVPGQSENTLWIYTERGFEKIAERSEPTFTPSKDRLRWEQMFYSSAETLEPDTQGRIVIPPRMLSRAGLGREVVICGVRDHLEIRRRDEFDRELEGYWADLRQQQSQEPSDS